MRKLISAVVLLALALVALVACTEGIESPTATRWVLPTSPPPTATASPAPPTPTVEPAETATEQPEATQEPTAAPAPTPIPLPGGELAYYSNIGPYLLANPEAGQPTHTLLKGGRMRAYMAINPAHWAPADALRNLEGYGRNYMAEEEELSYIRRREQGARGYYDRFRPTYEQGRGQIHAWMSTWAFTFGDPDFAEDWVAFQREWLRLMHADGHLAGVGGMKAHLFGSGEIVWLTEAIRDADYLFLAESGAPTLTASMGVTTLVYRDLVAELRAVLGEEGVPPLILDVCVDGEVLMDIEAEDGPHWQRGYRDYGTSPEAYAADVRNYDIATLYDPYVKHVFWFATNITEDTLSFDVNTPMLTIADGWHTAPAQP
jgi:hypothetical protein